jgi:ADP-heptose:LPS heptosyltransferase
LFRQDGTAGDVLLTTATVEGLYKKFSDYKIDYMTQGQYFDIVGDNPFINEICESGDWYSGYDEVFVPHNKILNAPWNIGDVHLRSLYSQICGVEEGKVLIIPQDYPIPFKKYVVVHTTSLPQKTYKKFDEIIKYLNLQVVQIGSPDDLPCFEVSLDLRGKTTYRQVASVLKGAEYLLGIDSFPAHCASAVGTPSIVIFGNTCARVCNPQFLSTSIEPDYVANCHRLSPCHNGTAGCVPLCIDTIQPEEILQVVRERFNNTLK